MITVKIGNGALEFQNGRDIDENWIVEQLNRRRRAGDSVCVRVSIDTQAVNVSLRTPNCATFGGGGRLANDEEQKVFDLWDKMGLNKEGFTGGNLIAFFKQLHRIID